MVWGMFGSSEPEQKTDGSEADYPECDYDKDLTPLYEAIEERAWIAVNQFLHSGYWPESLFEDPMSPEEQARTWVTRYETRPDGSKKVRWSQLPIHSAVIFGAPSVVIQQLVEAFPQSVRCTDDHRMLPLHLAFRHGSDDSVLALFLEEFPEAVNVRGYKGRLPVECAQKGPNPERGAIIQTIIQKNQSAWERKKSANQLKELYCVKEALKIKSQKVSHLETAIREIKSREHKTRKELATTMTELKGAKAKKVDKDEDEDTVEKEAIKELVEKLARLEMATKDLVTKENKTKMELKKTLAELESTKKMKHTDAQVQQFAKLDKVNSKDISTLEREVPAEKDSSAIKKTLSKVSSSGEAPVEVVVKSKEAPPLPKSDSREMEKAKLRKVEETNKDLEQKVATLEAAMKKLDVQASKAKEELDAISVPDQDNRLTAEQTDQMKILQEEMKALKENASKTQQELDAALKKLDEFKAEQDEKAAAIQKKEAEAAENKRKLDKKIALLELALKQFEEKSTMAKKEMKKIKDTISSEADLKLTPHQEKHLGVLEAAMKKLEKNAKKTKKELETALEEKKSLDEKIAEEALAGQAKLMSVEQTNKELEKKIALLEGTMKHFDDKAAKTKGDMESAMTALKHSSADSVTVKSGEEKLSKKQEKHMAMLEASMKKLEERANKTQKELDSALTELNTIKAGNGDKSAFSQAQIAKSESKALKALAKKVQALQSAMVGFEVKETRTMQDLEKTMKELEEVSKKRFEVLTSTAEHSHVLASDATFSKEVSKLDKKASKEEKKLAELEASVKDIISKSGSTKDELERTQKLLEEIQSKQVDAKEGPLTKEQKEEQKHDKKIIKELTKKVATLQSAVIGFEVKETRTMKELELTMKQLEELTSKRFEVLERAAATKEMDTERLTAQGALAEENVASLQTAMKEMEQNAAETKAELEKTRMELEEMKSGAMLTQENASKDVVDAQDKQIKQLNDKIGVLQQAVMGFEVKETKTMQELEQTMKQLEELTAKRFEVLQKVAGREIEAVKAAEASKYEKKAAEEEEKVTALATAMRDLESNALNTKLELERAMKSLEQLEVKQSAKQQEVTGISKEEKRVMRELVAKVADIQTAVIAYDEKEIKTNQELERTKAELEATKREVEALRSKHGETTTVTDAEPVQISTETNRSQVEVVELNEEDAQSQAASHAASETAKRVTEETLTTLEEAISRLVERLGDEEEAPETQTQKEEETPMRAVQATAAAVEPENTPAAVEPENTPAVAEPDKSVVSDAAQSVKTSASVAPEKSVVSEAEPAAAPAAVVESEKPVDSDAQSVKTSTSVTPEKSVVSEASAEPEQTVVSEARSAPAMVEPQSEPAAAAVAPVAVEEEVKAVSIAVPSTSDKSEASKTPPAKKSTFLKKTSKKVKKSLGGFFGANKCTTKTSIDGHSAQGSVASSEQRRMIEQTHGVEITSVLTDQQILMLLAKKQQEKEEQTQPKVETVTSADASVKSSIKDAASVKSTTTAKSNKSMKSMSSSKVAPMMVNTATEPTTPKSFQSSSPKTGAEVLVTARTYDDGFEINF